MTEDTLQTLADTQGAILGVLKNYLKLYDRQCRELEQLRTKLEKIHNLIYKLYEIPYLYIVSSVFRVNFG